MLEWKCKGSRQSEQGIVPWIIIGSSFLFACILALVYGILTPPLHRFFPLQPEWVEAGVHSFLLAGIGILFCLFLFRKRRDLLALGFTGLWLPVALCLIALLRLSPDERDPARFFLIYYLLIPVTMGNLVCWSRYILYQKRIPPHLPESQS